MFNLIQEVNPIPLGYLNHRDPSYSDTALILLFKIYNHLLSYYTNHYHILSFGISIHILKNSVSQLKCSAISPPSLTHCFPVLCPAQTDRTWTTSR